MQTIQHIDRWNKSCSFAPRVEFLECGFSGIQKKFCSTVLHLDSDGCLTSYRLLSRVIEQFFGAGHLAHHLAHNHPFVPFYGASNLFLLIKFEYLQMFFLYYSSTGLFNANFSLTFSVSETNKDQCRRCPENLRHFLRMQGFLWRRVNGHFLWLCGGQFRPSGQNYFL